MSPALYLIDTSGLFRILQEQHRQAWADQLASGVIATCSIVELEFLYSARSRADRAEKRRMLEAVFGWVPMGDDAYYGRWSDQTLRLANGRVEISPNNHDFAPLVDPWPGCEMSPG